MGDSQNFAFSYVIQYIFNIMYKISFFWVVYIFLQVSAAGISFFFLFIIFILHFRQYLCFPILWIQTPNFDILLDITSVLLMLDDFSVIFTLYTLSYFLVHFQTCVLLAHLRSHSRTNHKHITLRENASKCLYCHFYYLTCHHAFNSLSRP